MAYWFGDGFDLYTAVADCGTYWDASLGPAVLQIAPGRFAGSRGFGIFSSNGTTPHITKTSGVNDAVHHISVAIQQTVALSGATGGAWFSLYDGASAQCTVWFRSDGAMVLSSPGLTGTVLATYTGAIAAANTWYQFEIEIVISGTAGSIAVRKLGNTVNDFFAGSLNTKTTANNYANKLGSGSNWVSTNAQIFDDFLWRSDASALSWLGDIRCYTRMPASDASVTWSRFPTTAQNVPVVQTGTFTTANTSSMYQQVTAGYDGAVGSLTVSIATGFTGNMKCSIFADSAGSPGTLLGSATTVNNPATGNQAFTFSTPVPVVRNGLYWVGVACDGAYTNALNVRSATGKTYTVGYTAFPVSNPSPLNANNNGPIFTWTITLAGNFAAVDDPQQDGAASYNSSSTVGQSDLYGLAPLSATPGSIVGVTTRAYMEKSDAGTRIAAVQLQSGSANVQGSLVLNTVWSWAWRSDQVDPNTGAAWTATAVNNAQIGEIVTA